MIKYGFEREFFVQAQKQFVLCPAVIPHDECGYLAESRSEPHPDPLKAAYLLLATEYQLFEQAKRNRVKLLTVDAVELSPDLLRDALRRYGKDPVPSERGNIYGHDYAADDKTCRAGLHVHFSNQEEVEGKEHKRTINGFLDIPKYIRHLDGAFHNEIVAAKRIPGCYEIKGHGFEYRSLPASIDVRKVAAALNQLGR